MKFQPLAIVLTVINFIILILVLILFSYQTGAIGVAPVLRTRSLEIIDDQGKIRAQILVVPASSLKDGQTYPETVLLRLIDANGHPGVKIDTSIKGSGLLLTSDSVQNDWSGVQILAEGAGGLLNLRNTKGQEQVIQP